MSLWAHSILEFINSRMTSPISVQVLVRILKPAVKPRSSGMAMYHCFEHIGLPSIKQGIVIAQAGSIEVNLAQEIHVLPLHDQWVR